MGYSQYPAITDELLSAYIDNAVSAAERAAVETAIANDLEIAWRVESLRSTVSLLGQLTDVPLPRSFTLDDALVEMAPVSEPPRPALHPHSTDSSDSLWERWLDFWRSGSVAWRNAAAVCALLLLVFLVGDFAIVNVTQATQDEMAFIALDETTDTRMLAMDESEAAPAPAAVAMLPEPTNQAEERVVPVPTAAMETAEEERSETEAKSVQPATVAMNSEPEIEKEIAEETVEETILLKDSPSDDSVVEGIQSDIGTAEEAGEALPAAPAATAATVALSSASVTAGDAMTESALRLSPAAESGDGVDEPTAGLLVAASALANTDVPADNESVVAQESAYSPPPPEAVEPLAAEVAGIESTSAEPAASAAADVASPVDDESQPQAMMLTDATTAETDEAGMVDAESEEVAMMDVAETEISGAGRAFVASPETAAPQGEATPALVSELAAAELAVEDALLAEAAAETTQPSAVAMADSAEQSTTAQPGQPLSADMQPLVAPSAADDVPNSVRLFGIAQLLLASLALIFFVLWLRSRSQSATVSSQD